MKTSNTVGVALASLTFSDGTTIDCSGHDVVLVVGPNNVGKSLCLRQVLAAFNDPPNPVPITPVVVSSIRRSRRGTEGDVWNMVCEMGFKTTESVEESYIVSYRQHPSPAHGRAYRRRDVEGWDTSGRRIPIEQVFVRYLGAEGRQALSDDQQSIDFGRAPKTHPLHYLHQNPELRKQFSASFKRAFGQEIAIDLIGGSTIPLHVGEQALPGAYESELDTQYRDRLRSYPRIREQGDGMRSFAGLLLHCMVSYATVVLIDEPEAFLHPPQARLLARQLGDLRMRGIQLIIATHSTDVVRGTLESSNARTKVIRLRREGTVNVARELSHGDIQVVWDDPVLRYSNVLDGLFYQKVIVCEADGDCRFYHAVADALREPEDHSYLRDVMFVQAGGKGGIPKLVTALRKLEIPVAAVIDFDVLRERSQLEGLLRAFGFDFERIRRHYEAIRDNINRMGYVPIRDIKASIWALLDPIPDDQEVLPQSVIRGIQDALRPHIGWRKAKRVGVNVLDPGPPRAAAQTLLTDLAAVGIFLVPHGELESFEPLEAAEKNAWVNEVLEKYRGRLATAPELASAREFVSRMIAEEPVPKPVLRAEMPREPKL